MSEKKRKAFSAQQKVKVALEAIRGIKTVNEIAQKFGIHPTQVSHWKREDYPAMRFVNLEITADKKLILMTSMGAIW